MRFEVFAARLEPASHGPQAVVLVPDSQDDDEYLTLHDLWFRDGSGSVALLGQVKVGYSDQVRGQRPMAAAWFETLEGFQGQLYWFSLGQDDAYYENVRKLGPTLRVEILTALRDVAFSHKVFHEALLWDVTRVSLMRSVERRTVEDQFRRIALGGPRLTEYRFEYIAPPGKSGESPSLPPRRLTFEVTPHASPPTNIHVLIGRNGVGKTTLLRNIAQAVLSRRKSDAVAGAVAWYPWGTRASFANVVSVTFSAFDPFAPLNPRSWPGGTQAGYAYVGLAKTGEPGGHVSGERKSYDELGEEFRNSLVEVLAAGRGARWIRALDRLSSDPYLADLPLSDLIDSLDGQPGDEDLEEVEKIFSALSSGHKIVLLTITRLVETIVERSLVLLDEPEAHLHPPLLAAFIRALSDLLIDRNGVALIATHSPVVLQEVPRSCVWKLNGWGTRLPTRPGIETFGENVGVLTHEVFGLEVRESGFHAELNAAVNELGTYESVLQRFNGQLGGEAKGLVRILLAHRGRR
ncbi:AAA family ATPase [Streptomyces virginiae]|uniref:AAA family ATPase n=1 Tax=Streptomyces virginiae TaxID=1961 RepID=UPI003454DC60